MYDVKKCELVSECTLLWKDACYLNRCPTIMCLAKKKTKKNDEGSKPEILSRTAQATVALTRLKPVWNDRSISLSSKI